MLYVKGDLGGAPKRGKNTSINNLQANGSYPKVSRVIASTFSSNFSVRAEIVSLEKTLTF